MSYRLPHSGTLAVVLLSVAPMPLRSQTDHPFAPESGAILTGVAARDALGQCTRQGPDTLSGIWTPTATDIARLEERFGSFLQARLDSVRRASGDTSMRLESSDYYRQYIGVVGVTRRFIYVNGFRRECLALWSTAMNLSRRDTSSAANSPHFDWHRWPVVVCDGGAAFFGVLYDPESNAFVQFHFNEGG